jgi:hypothetical protein
MDPAPSIKALFISHKKGKKENKHKQTKQTKQEPTIPQENVEKIDQAYYSGTGAGAVGDHHSCHTHGSIDSQAKQQKIIIEFKRRLPISNHGTFHECSPKYPTVIRSIVPAIGSSFVIAVGLTDLGTVIHSIRLPIGITVRDAHASTDRNQFRIEATLGTRILLARNVR